MKRLPSLEHQIMDLTLKPYPFHQKLRKLLLGQIDHQLSQLYSKETLQDWAFMERFVEQSLSLESVERLLEAYVLAEKDRGTIQDLQRIIEIFKEEHDPITGQPFPPKIWKKS
ncbi:MAG: hypothetical protein OXC92_02475 [Flavobacteriaceae bacterium]|nr:hypothetical protein [Flavobacteriaceae bacterium]MCY4215833.1 hypothetical protein [Flavobacteriaceae bacterium]MCY4253970.1 hypothetical protein [Flavobacteriaceae bacterium]